MLIVGDTATDKLDAARATNIMKINYFGISVTDGEEAPIGFENFEWNNEKMDFIEKD